MKNKILVIAAHPDDEVLGCGATIAKHAAQGDEVTVLILGEGVSSRTGLTRLKKNKCIFLLKQSAKTVNKLLGVNNLILKDLPDNKFDTVPLLSIVQEIEKVVSKQAFNVIYTHSYSDVNIDHRKIVEAIESVIRPTKGSSIHKVLSFEVPSSTNWNFIKKTFSPNYFVEIDQNSLDKKMKALEIYKSEMRTFPHPRSPEYIKALAMIRGAQAGFNYSESFELIFQRS